MTKMNIIMYNNCQRAAVLSIIDLLLSHLVGQLCITNNMLRFEPNIAFVFTSSQYLLAEQEQDLLGLLLVSCLQAARYLHGKRRRGLLADCFCITSARICLYLNNCNYGSRCYKSSN